MRAVACRGESWWSLDGALVVVFTGLPTGEIVLPVRLPSAPSNQPILDHHLADPLAGTRSTSCGAAIPEHLAAGATRRT
jgi:hypothetical protein